MDSHMNKIATFIFIVCSLILNAGLARAGDFKVGQRWSIAHGHRSYSDLPPTGHDGPRKGY